MTKKKRITQQPKNLTNMLLRANFETKKIA